VCGEVPGIPGAAEVVAWFRYWPTFHDAEVLSITLDRSRGSTVAIHAFEMTPEVRDGQYVLAKHAVVTFCLEGFRKGGSWCWRVVMEWTAEFGVRG